MRGPHLFIFLDRSVRRTPFRPRSVAGPLRSSIRTTDLPDPEGTKLDVSAMVLEADVAAQRLLPQFHDGLLIDIDNLLAVDVTLMRGPAHSMSMLFHCPAGRIAFLRGATYRYNDPLECTVGGLPASSNNWIS